MTHPDEVAQRCEAVDASGHPQDAVPPTPTADEPLIVAVAGAYSSGKTSLIKRILFEMGLPIPAELAVAADPATFEPLDVPAGLLTLRDTPGLGSGKTLHNDRAVDACADADVIALVLTPQLLSAADEDAWGVATGEAWGRQEEPTDESLVLIINRFDLCGAHPVDEHDAYLERARKKDEELRASLAGRGVDSAASNVFVIAADPFGLVDDELPEESSYGAGQGWDGVGDLLQWIEMLPDRLTGLRFDRAVRVRARRLHQSRDAVRLGLSQASVAIKSAERNLHACSSDARRLQRIRDKSQPQRDEALHAAIGHDAKAATAPDRNQVIRERLTTHIQQWVSSYADELGAFAQDISQTTTTPELPTPGTASLPTMDPAADSDRIRVLFNRVRSNDKQIRDAAAAIRGLGDTLPRLEPAKTWLNDTTVDAALKAVDLLWRLSGHEDKGDRAEQEKRREHYLQLAREAAEAAVAPLEAWAEQVSSGLHRLQAEASEALDDARAAEQEARERLHEIDQLLASVPARPKNLTAE